MPTFWTRLATRMINFYPPFLGARIRVKYLAPDHSIIQSSMRLSFLNRNILGVHFGGSLYSMCDPFYLLILMLKLGRDYIVWDKSASVRFRRPGRGLVTARFEIAEDVVSEIKRKADAGEKIEPQFVAKVLDESGEVVAEVTKILSVRRKPVVSI